MSHLQQYELHVEKRSARCPPGLSWPPQGGSTQGGSFIFILEKVVGVALVIATVGVTLRRCLKTFFKNLIVVLLCPGFSWRSPASAPPPCWRSVPSPSASSCPNSPSQVCRSASFAFRPFSPAHRSAGSATPRSPTPTPSESDPAGGPSNQHPTTG